MIYPTPETIIQQIADAKGYWMHAGTRLEYPTAIYLGRAQDQALKAYAAQYLQMRHDASLIGKRSRWEGMEIFVVDADDHIDFGLNAPKARVSEVRYAIRSIH